MPSNNSKYTQEIREQTAKYVLKNGKYSTNKVKQEFKLENANEVWVGDITYLRTSLGWVYIAAVMELYNREIIVYAVSRKIDT